MSCQYFTAISPSGRLGRRLLALLRMIVTLPPSGYSTSPSPSVSFNPQSGEELACPVRVVAGPHLHRRIVEERPRSSGLFRKAPRVRSKGYRSLPRG